MDRPVPTATLSLSKFDVAERQLLQAIRMFFAEEDAVSIHTLSEAAGQVLHDIGKTKGVFSLVRDYERIRPERKKEWLDAIFRSRNFFKHADKDANAVREFKDVFNDFSLLDSMNMYATLKKRWTPETLMFMVWFGLAHPHLVRETADLHEVLQRLKANHDNVTAEWASPEIPDTELRCKDGLGGVGWVPEGCSPGSSRSRRSSSSANVA